MRAAAKPTVPPPQQKAIGQLTGLHDTTTEGTPCHSRTSTPSGECAVETDRMPVVAGQLHHTPRVGTNDEPPPGCALPQCDGVAHTARLHGGGLTHMQPQAQRSCAQRAGRLRQQTFEVDARPQLSPR